jgi:hypothetical protein
MTMTATKAGLAHVTRSGSSDISQRQGRQPDGTGASDAATRLSYPAAVAVWIGAGLLGWGLIAGLVVALT